MPKKSKVRPGDLKVCKEVMREHGPTYYYPTRLFPKKIREATYVLYAFYRVPDDMVDERPDLNPSEKAKLLEAWIKKWKSALEGEKCDEPVLRAALAVHQEFQIPKKYSLAFLKSMHMDLEKDTYESYLELKDYMYGSAAVVGIMMTYVIGEKGGLRPPREWTLEKAADLGFAMQLTNFLRDVHEDLKDRGRVYLPEDELDYFGVEVSSLHLAAKDSAKALELEASAPWISFMKEQILRAQGLYTSGFEGLKALPIYARIPILYASRLYQSYLRKIEKANYHLFDRDFSLTKFQKIIYFFKIFT